MAGVASDDRQIQLRQPNLTPINGLRYTRQLSCIIRAKCEYCIIGRGDRMTSLRQSVDRGNADRCFAVDSADTVEPHERCWILIGLLVEPVT
jgi:hypothetical protein